jgi:chromosome segregation ATPase
MQTVEDRIRERVKTNEETIKTSRVNMYGLLSFENGALVVDPRYKKEVSELQRQQASLRSSTETLEKALNSAQERTAKLDGIKRSNPLTWLQDRVKKLKAEIGANETEVNVLKTNLQSSQGVGGGYNKITRQGQFQPARDPLEGWRQQLKRHEAQLDALKPELARVETTYREVEQILTVARV